MLKALFQHLRTSSALQRTRISTTIIMVLAAFVSYGHQRALLVEWGVDTTASLIVPLTVDFLAITCNIVVHIPDVRTRGFIVSLLVLIVAVAVSGLANFYAGQSLIAKLANLWTVVAYLLSEFVTASAKPKTREKDPVRVQAGKKGAQTRKATPRKTRTTRAPRAPKPSAIDAELDKMLDASAAVPVSPAPAGK